MLVACIQCIERCNCAVGKTLVEFKTELKRKKMADCQAGLMEELGLLREAAEWPHALLIRRTCALWAAGQGSIKEGGGGERLLRTVDIFSLGRSSQAEIFVLENGRLDGQRREY